MPVSLRLRRAVPCLAVLLSLSAVSINVVLFHQSLQLSDREGGFELGRSFLDSGLLLESDPEFLAVVEQVPGVSEQTFSEAMQLVNLKIYIYDLPPIYNEGQLRINALHPPKIWDPNCTTNFYSAEVSLHRFLTQSSHRTLEPMEADFFYVPAYSCCFLINNHPNNLTKTAIFHRKLFNHIRSKYPYFNRSSGRDHVWSFTQGFGAQLFGKWRLIKNSIFLVHNGQFTLDEFTPYKDLTIPPDLTGYNFSTVHELPPSKRPPRKWLAHFGGTVLPMNLTDERGSHYSKGVRQYIKEHYSKDPDFCITGTRVKTYVRDMMSSTFCLCPEGWHAWNPRPYQAILLGCIPVLLSEEIELAFEEVIDYSSFMIRVKPSDIGNLKTILQSVPPARVELMRRELERVWRLFTYGPRGLAPHMILKMLARRKSPHHIRREYQSI